MNLLNSQKKTGISIVLGSYNRLVFLKKTIESVRNNRITVPYEIIVVDGGSTDGSLKWLAKQKDIITIIQHNHGKFRGKAIQRQSWGYFMNLGFKCAQGKYILMISDDCLVVTNAIMNGYADFEQRLANGEKIGALAFYWRNFPEQKDYWVGFTLGGKLFVNHGLYLRSALQEVNWIDESTYFFYHADGDLCLKLWDNGYSVEDCKTSFIEHFNHLKPNPISSKNDWAAYIEKWKTKFLKHDINNTGGWIYQTYDDKTQTYKRFPFITRMRQKLVMILVHNKNIIRFFMKKVKLNAIKKA